MESREARDCINDAGAVFCSMMGVCGVIASVVMSFAGDENAIAWLMISGALLGIGLAVLARPRG
jgi:H+/gluconate symporter-like permease